MKINVLPPSVFNLLAAGEVVENPAAIVKECVENSIDAGATRIEIAIWRAGLDKIKITDNGKGVAAGEIELVFAPHATSKILNAADLEKIDTLGFRGEAMASIAAVSDVEFVSNDGAQTATALKISGGKIISKKSVARERGTTVTIANLFFNTPARAKFLHSAGVEKNAVTGVVMRVILANPRLTVRYTVDDEIVYDYRGKTLLDAINALYADTNNGQMLAVDKKDAKMSIHGYIGTPTFSKRNRTYQTTIINGRFIEGGVVADAANAAFANFITTGNFPFFVLELTTDPRTVDVNVHPRKAQVKFSATDEIAKFVTDAVTEALDRYLLEKHKTNYSSADDDELRKRMAFFTSDDNDKVKCADHIMHIYDLADRPEVPTPTTHAPEPISLVRHDKKPTQEQFDSAILQKYRIVGTIFNTYILLETTDAFHIVDQHAAHERILYDRLSKQIDNKRVEQQRLLDCGVLVMSAEEMTKMDAAAQTLNECGLECAPFGTNCYRFTAVPTLIATHGVDLFLDQLLRDVKTTSVEKISTLLKDKIVTQCCRAAIKAGATLPTDEIRTLVNAALDGKTRPTCPHGRPIIISYTKSQIEKMFARK